MPTVLLALGSNVGDSQKYVLKAIELLGGKLDEIKVAPMYRSKAVGYTEQPDFINTALQATTKLEPSDLLHFVKDVEQQVGRIFRFRWGPREIDIDIIFYDDLILKTPGLTIPHPSFAERDFVLRPIQDLAPNFIDPKSGASVKTLYEALPPNRLAILS